MNQVPVAVDAPLLVAWTRIHDSPVGKHGSSLVWNVEDVSVAFLALVVLK